MTDMKDRAREYLRSQTQLNGGGLFHCNILNLILGFAEQETKELKKSYDDSLVACGILKAKIDTLAQPSPLESMQDVLITAQKAVNEKQQEQLTKAMKHLKDLVYVVELGKNELATARILAEAKEFLKEE